jgi:hypothetical protein
MRRLILVVALALLVVSAGCLSLGSDDSDGATPTDESIEYTIESGNSPEEFASVNVTMQVVFTKGERDFSRNRCWRETYNGPYKPEITAIGTPSGECHRTEQLTVDLTDLNGTQTLEATPPEQFEEGHGLIVTGLSATHRNGTSISTIQGIGGHRANIVEGDSGGQYAVEFAIGRSSSAYDAWGDYALTSAVTEDDSGRRPVDS